MPFETDEEMSVEEMSAEETPRSATDEEIINNLGILFSMKTSMRTPQERSDILGKLYYSFNLTEALEIIEELKYYIIELLEQTDVADRENIKKLQNEINLLDKTDKARVKEMTDYLFLKYVESPEE